MTERENSEREDERETGRKTGEGEERNGVKALLWFSCGEIERDVGVFLMPSDSLFSLSPSLAPSFFFCSSYFAL